MGNNNSRIYEGDALTTIGDTSGGNVIIDMNRADRFSIQAVYDVTANAAAAAIATANIKTSADATHPSEFNKTAHGLLTGVVVRATTAGTLAVPLAVSTDYFVIKVSADYFALATTLAGALAGTRIAITNVGVTSTTLTPSALSASLTLQKSNDRVTWTDLQAATAITVDGSIVVEVANVSYRWLNIKKTLSGGVVNLKAHLLVLGE